MLKNKHKFILLILVILLSIIALPNSIVYADSDDLTIKIFGEGIVEVEATSAEIYGTIECVNIDQNKANKECENILNLLLEYINSMDFASIETTYKSIYPLSQTCYRSNEVYMSYANFVIKLSVLDKLSTIYDNIYDLENIKIDGIQYKADSQNGYIEALKQAIAVAHSKASALYSSDLSILEVDEKEMFSNSSTYISSDNFDFTKIPTISICAKVEVTYKTK